MDYLSYFTTLPNFPPMSLLLHFLLSLVRLAPIVVIPPFLGGKMLPGATKIGIVIILSFVFLPILAQVSTPPKQFSLDFAGLALKELIIGYFLSFLITIPFLVAQSSGIFIDYMRGASILQQQDPLLQNQASPIGMLFNFILIYIFYQIDGLFLFFSAIEKSYKVIPPEAYVPSLFFSAKSPVWQQCFALLQVIAALSIQLAGPGIVAILMTEMFLGIANRLAPQVQIAFLGMSLKSLVGLGILWMGLFFILRQFGTQTLKWITTMDKLIDSMIPLMKL